MAKPSAKWRHGSCVPHCPSTKVRARRSTRRLFVAGCRCNDLQQHLLLPRHVGSLLFNHMPEGGPCLPAGGGSRAGASWWRHVSCSPSDYANDACLCKPSSLTRDTCRGSIIVLDGADGSGGEPQAANVSHLLCCLWQIGLAAAAMLAWQSRHVPVTSIYTCSALRLHAACSGKGVLLAQHSSCSRLHALVLPEPPCLCPAEEPCWAGAHAAPGVLGKRAHRA